MMICKFLATVLMMGVSGQFYHCLLVVHRIKKILGKISTISYTIGTFPPSELPTLVSSLMSLFGCCGYKSLISYMFGNYFLLLCGLPLLFFNSVSTEQ